MKKSKSLGQVFTPDDEIERILTEAGYFGGAVLNSKILEPSFGDGRFIKKILHRLILYCKMKHMSNEEIAQQIENNIYGIEVDHDVYQKAKDEILEYIYSEIGIYADVNLYLDDTLSAYKNYLGFFDFVVGNPPYVRVQNIKDKSVLQSFYFTSKSAGDLYLAFFEVGIKMLKQNTGRLAFITPSAWMYNKSGEIMRDYITGWPILRKIIDFGHYQVFDGFSTYTAITVLDMHCRGFFVDYECGSTFVKKRYEDIWLDKRFCFAPVENMRVYREIEKVSTDCLCEVKNGYATLADKFFIDNKEIPENPYMIPVCKSSTHKTYNCFYPYDENGIIIPLEQIQKHKDLYNYLINHKEQLEHRSLDKSSMWYGFGRSQAIKDTYKNKFAINAIVKNVGDVQLTECPSGTGVYGGLYLITPYSKEKILSILNSDKFFEYLSYIGTKKQGGYWSFNSSQLEKYLNFILLQEELIENKVLYTECFGYVEPIKIISKMEDRFGIYYHCITEDNCDAGFWLKEVGNTVFLTEIELREKRKLNN